MATGEGPGGGSGAGKACPARPSPPPLPGLLLHSHQRLCNPHPAFSGSVSGMLVTGGSEPVSRSIPHPTPPQQINSRPKRFPNLAGSYLPGQRWEGSVDPQSATHRGPALWVQYTSPLQTFPWLPAARGRGGFVGLTLPSPGCRSPFLLWVVNSPPTLIPRVLRFSQQPAG